MSGRDAGWGAAHAPVEAAAELPRFDASAAPIKEVTEEPARLELLASEKIMRTTRRGQTRLPIEMNL